MFLLVVLALLISLVVSVVSMASATYPGKDLISLSRSILFKCGKCALL